jgi:hypothetical protein
METNYFCPNGYLLRKIKTKIMEQNVTSTTTKGVVIGLILILLALVTYFGNIDINGPIKWLGYIIFILGIIWAVYSYGKQINYNATFGNYFAHGFKVSALVTAIMIIYLIIFITIFPDFKEKAMDEARKKMQEQNKLTQEQITQSMEGFRKFFMVIVVGGTLLVYIITGAIASLVGAAITKKDPGQIPSDLNQI